LEVCCIIERASFVLGYLNFTEILMDYDRL